MFASHSLAYWVGGFLGIVCGPVLLGVVLYLVWLAYVRMRLSRDNSGRIAEWVGLTDPFLTVSLGRILLSASKWTVFLIVLILGEKWLTQPDRGAQFRDGLASASIVLFAALFVLMLVSRLIDRARANRLGRFVATNDGLFAFGYVPLVGAHPYLPSLPAMHILWKHVGEIRDRERYVELWPRRNEFTPFPIPVPNKETRRLIQERIPIPEAQTV
jgi:hypothetical protein